MTYWANIHMTIAVILYSPENGERIAGDPSHVVVVNSQLQKNGIYTPESG